MERLVIKQINAGEKTCDFCQSVEGKFNLGNWQTNKLKAVDVLGTQKQACQTCEKKYVKLIYDIKMPIIKDFDYKRMHIVKKILSVMVPAIVLMMLFSVDVLSQPGLPSAPSQAPIDGGLSLLAAAGGAYAIKKLRTPKKSEEGLN